MAAFSLLIASAGWLAHDQLEQARLAEQLVVAVKARDADGVRRLLAAGASPNARDAGPAGGVWGHIRATLQGLVGRRPDQRGGMPALVLATEETYCDWTVADLLVARGADPNAAARRGGTTPFGRACAAGPRELVRGMIEHGADLNRREAGGWSPLSIAAAWNNEGALLELLQHGADPRLSKMPGCTVVALMAPYKAGRARLALVRRVLALDPDVTTGRPLNVAAGCDNLDVVRLLAARGADVNATDEAGRTPLMRAAGCSPACVRFLLSQGADPLAQGPDGVTARELAMHSGARLTAGLLLRAERERSRAGRTLGARRAGRRS